MHRGRTLALAAAAVLVAQSAEAFPDRTITMIVPFSAGGTNDSVARALAPELAEALGGDVIVKNVDGAAGTLGSNQILSARADGYTIGFVPMGPVVVQNHLRSLPYQLESWKPICNVYQSPLVLVTNADSDIQSVEDLKAAGEVIYGSTGPGTVNHLSAAAAVDALGIEGRHLPDKGAGPAMLSLANGTIDLFSDTPIIVNRYDVTPIATLSPERLPQLPDLPTMKELGYDVDFSLWAGVFVSAETPDDIAAQLMQACETAVESDSFTASAERIGIDLNGMYGEPFATFVREEYGSMPAILETAGLID